MEILRIGKQAVKVFLSKEEAREYRITYDNELDEAEIKEVFSSLLAEIKNKTDFSYANKKIFTEIFPSKDGGCEIYISCISAEANDTVYKDKSYETEAKKKIPPSIYAIDSIENLLSISYRLNAIKHREKSSIYYDADKKRYFLVLENANAKGLKYAFILEYARYIKGTNLNYIKEHYDCLIKKEAVRILSALT